MIKRILTFFIVPPVVGGFLLFLAFKLSWGLDGQSARSPWPWAIGYMIGGFVFCVLPDLFLFALTEILFRMRALTTWALAVICLGGGTCAGVFFGCSLGGTALLSVDGALTGVVLFLCLRGQFNPLKSLPSSAQAHR